MTRPHFALLLALLMPLTGCALFRVRPRHYPPVVLASGLTIQDLVVPETELVPDGAVVWVHFEGRLASTGEVFDSSYREGEPVRLELGVSDIPAGMAEGLVGMPVGGRRLLTIPPDLAYGSDGIPGRIPANETLSIVVEVIELE